MYYLPEAHLIPASARLNPLALGHYMLGASKFSPLLNHPVVKPILVEDELATAEQGHWQTTDFLSNEVELVRTWGDRRPQVAAGFYQRAKAWVAGIYGETGDAAETRLLLRLTAGRLIDVALNGATTWAPCPSLLVEVNITAPCPGLPEDLIFLGRTLKAAYGRLDSKEGSVAAALANDDLVARVEQHLLPELTKEGKAFEKICVQRKQLAALRQWEEKQKVPAVLNGVILPIRGQLPEGISWRERVGPKPSKDGLAATWLLQLGLAPYITAPLQEWLQLPGVRHRVRWACEERDLYVEAVGRFYWAGIESTAA